MTKLGTFLLGYENVDLFISFEGGGGHLELSPDSNEKAFIKIGLAVESWDVILSLLLHETMEFLLLRAFSGFQPINSTYIDTSKRVFIMSHSLMDEICDRQAIFISEVLPRLADAYKKHCKKKGV